ncbi:hypothetical protein ACO0LB_11620 [Undibacterium sp. SXout7W]|uniref:hypothetical protein n=1 Tax=Undibacterium sp. SXout7W TaxID=3413049 RepID=UPI003BF298D4
MQTFQLPDITEYFAIAAGVNTPWRARQYMADDSGKTLHLWITRQPQVQQGQKQGWFASRQAKPSAPQPVSLSTQRWRHLDCMEYQCFIYTDDTLNLGDYELPWFGTPDMPFTNRLARKVFQFLMEGMDLQVICDVLHVSFGDLWKFKYSLDNGLLNFEYTSPSVRTLKPAPAMSDSGAAGTAVGTNHTSTTISDVPDMSDPVWLQLINGELDIQIKTLSFQFLLTRLRQQVSRQQSADIRLMKQRELHRYVERNQRVLSFELRQLRNN